MAQRPRHVKTGFVADVHVGNAQKWGGPKEGGVNTRCAHVIETLGRAVAQAREAGCKMLVILGDLFDYVRVEPQVVARVQAVLRDFQVVVLVGNHDQNSTQTGDHALAALQDQCTVIARPTLHTYRLGKGRIELWVVPFESGDPRDWLPEHLEALSAEASEKVTARYLCLHVGLSDSSTPYYLDSSGASLPVAWLWPHMESYGIDMVFSGDWHRHAVWEQDGRSVVQVGSLAPPRFPPGEYEHAHKGPLVIADRRKLSVLDVPGPRFYKLEWAQRERLGEVQGNPAYLKLMGSPEDQEDMQREVERLVVAGVIRRGEVELHQAKEAEGETPVPIGRDSVNDALPVFVESMPWEDDLDRDRLLARVRGFIDRARA
jgi:DNA repair exonuclease SbcCD nuclease subunit